MKFQTKVISTLFLFVTCELNFIQGASSADVDCRIFNRGSTDRQSCCNKWWRNSQRRDQCRSNPNIVRQNQNSGNRQQGQQSAIFNNDAKTQVGTQIGPNSAFNNQPGGEF